MARRHGFPMFLALSLLAHAFCLPPEASFRKRRDTSISENPDTSLIPDDVAKVSQDLGKDITVTEEAKAVTSADDDDDDDFSDDKAPASSGGDGSNIFSLINVASALLPSLSGNNNVKKNNEFVKKVIRTAINRYQTLKIQRRQDIGDNVIDIDYATELKPPYLERQESDESNENDSNASTSSSEEDNGAEVSVEQASPETKGSKSKQDSASNASNGNSDGSNDSDYDEPEGDGQGGGILGLLAGLSGGDGESDLGSLLAAVGGIVANLSGDGVDINALIATGLGLFVGLLSDENANPGEVIGSYLLTSLDTITGGGAQNNGAFFGNFLSTLVKGTSATGDSNSASDESGGGGKMADSAGFVLSLLMGLSGDMSKQSSGGSSSR